MKRDRDLDVGFWRMLLFTTLVGVAFWYGVYLLIFG